MSHATTPYVTLATRCLRQFSPSCIDWFVGLLGCAELSRIETMNVLTALGCDPTIRNAAGQSAQKILESQPQSIRLTLTALRS